MQQILTLFRIPELRRKIFMTLLLLFVYRIGYQIPVPGVNLDALRAAAEKVSGGSFGSLFGIMNAFTGANLESAALFSLGVMPYISASIIFSLLVKVSDRYQKLSKEGASGQKRINQETRLATVGICLVQAAFIYFGVIANPELGLRPQGWTLGHFLTVVVSLTAGTMFVMWLGEQITEHGVGNGISLIIMTGIIAEMPTALEYAFRASENAHQLAIMLVALWIVTVLVVVYITRGQRRIPIQQAKLTRGRKVIGGSKHYLPLRVNQANVMPIIFASALFIVPNALGQIPGLEWMRELFQSAGFVYIAFFTALIFFFSFFWTRLMFQPDEIADNLKEHGSFIPGIRPGKATADYLSYVLDRITLAGAAFLSVIAILPSIVTSNLRIPYLVAYFLGGTSILIVVGVALDIVDKLNSFLLMRNYDGFMKAGGSGWARRTQ